METRLSNHKDEIGLAHLTYLTLPLTAFPDGVFVTRRDVVGGQRSMIVTATATATAT